MGRLALNVLPALLAGEASLWIRAAKRNALVSAIVIVLALGAYALVLAAAAIAIGETFGLVVGLLIVAGALLASVASALAVARIVTARQRRMRHVSSRRGDFYLAAAAAALPVVLRSKPLALAALGAGVLAWAASGARNEPEHQV